MSEIFFTADNHFGHANIVKYENRPFKNVNDMDEQMIKLWNNKVKKGDSVYVIGDFAFCKTGEYVKKLINRLICEHECIYYLNEIEKSKKVNIYWREDSEFRWELDTLIPHVDFNIYDGDEGFCRGIVFKLTDI